MVCSLDQQAEGELYEVSYVKEGTDGLCATPKKEESEWLREEGEML